MSAAPSGNVLYRYIPGVGKVSAVQCDVKPVATAISTSDQILVAGTAALVAHDTVPFTYDILVAGGTFTVLSAGVYKIIPSIEFYGLGNGTITIWLKVNGTNVPNSSTVTAFKNNDEGVITTEYLLELNAQDSIQVWGYAGGANCRIDYVAAMGVPPNNRPAAPGAITNIYKIR